MSEWCMTHPWMTFWIIIVGLGVINSVVDNLCNVVRAKAYRKFREQPR